MGHTLVTEDEKSYDHLYILLASIKKTNSNTTAT